jgi:hypothetical protein
MTKWFKQRALSSVLFTWLVCQVCCTLLQVEYFPFFLFGFYSDPVPEQFVTYEIRNDGKPVQLPLLKKEFIHNQLAYYDYLLKHKGKDPELDAMIKRRVSSKSVRRSLGHRLKIRLNYMNTFKGWFVHALRSHGYSGKLNVLRLTKFRGTDKILKEDVFAHQ